MAALRAGKHVLMEKPLASTAEHASRLLDEADRRGLALMVDHTFVYTPAVQKIRQLAQAGELGELYYYDSVRINLGLFQHDVNVLWDLAVHDLSIMDFVLGTQPVAVSATGLAHVSGRPENIAYLTMFFESRLIAHMHVNWLAPVKIRRTLVSGSRRMVVFDDLEASEKIKVYDRGISVDGGPGDVDLMRIGYRTGDMWAPQLAIGEALHAVARQFVDLIVTKSPSPSDGPAGLRVVRLLEAATESMANQGRPVSVVDAAAS
jgi:predicted dehydrogenase